MVTPHTGRSLLEGQDLLLQGGELQHAQGVVLQQETPQRVPAPADAHHHVLPVKHLLNKDGSFETSKEETDGNKNRR